MLRVNPASGASQGYVLQLPPFTEALFPSLQAGVFYAAISSFSLTTPRPPDVVAAYRLSATGSSLLWRTPLQQPLDTTAGMATYDAQTVYLTTWTVEDHTWTIFAYRLSDGTLVWREKALATARMAVIGGAGARGS